MIVAIHVEYPFLDSQVEMFGWCPHESRSSFVDIHVVEDDLHEPDHLLQ